MSKHPDRSPQRGIGRETVDAHLVAPVLRASPEERAQALRDRFVSEKPGCAELVLVVDSAGRLVGVVTTDRLLTADGNTPLGELMNAGFPHVPVGTDQERAASLALHHDVDALPIVDAERRPIGIMPSQSLLRILRREHVEDLHVLAGIQREAAQARHAIEDPPLRRAQHRLPWLLVGLLGSMLATAAMAGFEATLQAKIAAAFFVPGIVYLADAIGTQSEAIAVRGLSLTRAGIGNLLLRELGTGMLIGGALGALAYLPIVFVFEDARLAGAVSGAIFASGSIACGIGLAFPWLLARLGLDPAYGSGPVATIIQDVLSILVYFAMLRAFGF